MEMRKAAIDTGSYSVRLLVADVRNGQPARVEKQISPTRLLEGIAEDGALAPAAIDRTAAAIASLAARAAELGAEQVRLFGTSAVREAPNRADLLERVKAMCGLEMAVLSGEDEARWAYFAAARPGRCGVIDIGGGSTELITGADFKYARANSTKIGAVRLKQSLPVGADCGTQIAYAREAMDMAVRDISPVPDTWVGVGGSITTLCAMQLEMAEYVPERIQGAYVALSAARVWIERLDSMALEDRYAVPGLPARRADIITQGLAILIASLELANADGLYISDRDNLYTGIMLDV